jgi:radical SAM protein with 4Fe4S-binding SPASM domain
MYTLLSAPLDVQWEVTPWCTYNCAHCYNYWRRGKKPRRLLTKAQLIAHHLTAKVLVENRVFHVTLTGGEPFGVIEQIIPELEFLRSNGIHLSVNTNLALMTPKIGEMLKGLGIGSILTSLMSADENINDEIAQQKGAYKLTVRGIKLAVSMGFRVSVNMVVSQKNFHTIYETGKLAYKLGAKAFCATKVSKPSNCPDFTGYLLTGFQLGQMLIELLRLKGDFGIQVDSLEPYPVCSFPNDEARKEFGSRRCSAARTSCTVGFDGQVRPCSHAPITYGNIASTELTGAWESMRAWRDDRLIPETCRSTCGEYPRYCNAGCRVEALNAGLQLSGQDPYCKGKPPITERILTKPLSLPSNASIRLLPTVRFRKEAFGYVAYRSSANWQAMDGTLHDILKKTLKGKGIAAHQLAKAYNANESDALETMSVLVSKYIAEKI